jgi:hypothetical protein
MHVPHFPLLDLSLASISVHQRFLLHRCGSRKDVQRDKLNLMVKKKTDGAAKAVRFTRVVERSGRPRPHTLWLAPEKDPELKRAIAAHRVMMVEPGSAGGKTDFGMVGFNASDAASAQILIFPKSLKAFEGARVVGIKFDLVEQPKMETARAPAPKPVPRRVSSPAPSAARTPPPAPSKPSKPQPPEPEENKSAPDEQRDTPDTALRREVRAALEELEAGKAVAAYKRLQNAVS